jgi:hypothetical protein
MDENLGDEVDQSLNLHGNHVWIFGLYRFYLFCGLTALRAAPSIPSPIFMIGLAGTLSEKSRACLWPRRSGQSRLRRSEGRHASPR